MTTDFISSDSLAQFRLEAEAGGTALLFSGDARRLLALLDAQRAALERSIARCHQCLDDWKYGFAPCGELCPACGEARKLLAFGEKKEDENG